MLESLILALFLGLKETMSRTKAPGLMFGKTAAKYFAHHILSLMELKS